MEAFKLLLQRLLLLAFLVLAFWFCWTNRSTLATVVQLLSTNALLILASYLFLYLLRAALLCMLLRQRGRTVPLVSLLTLDAWFALRGNATLLKEGGTPAKAAALRQQFQVPVNLGAGLMAMISLATLFTNAAAGILTGVYAMIAQQDIVPLLYWLVLSASLLLCVSIVLGIYKRGGVARLPRKMQIWVTNLHAVFTGTNHNEVIGLIALVALTLVPGVLALSLLFTALDAALPLYYLVFIAIFSNLLVISVTPANLGLRELVILLLLGHLDLGVVQLICVLLVDRLLQSLIVVLLGLGGRVRLKQDKAALQTAG